MAKPILTQDETGQRWFVYQDDPGWAACHALWLYGVRELVVPRGIIVRGVADYPRIPDMSEWEATNEAVARLVRRYVRLRDCTKWLEEHNLGVTRLRTDAVEVTASAMA